MKLYSRLPSGVAPLLLALFTFATFALLAESVVHRRAITQFDAQQADRCFEYAYDNLAVWQFFSEATDLGSGKIRVVVIAVVALLLILERRYWLTLIWCLVQLAERESVPWLKALFERPRPPGNDLVCKLSDPSFPSGHATGAMTLYGMMAYLFLLRFERGWWRIPVVVVLLGLVLLIGLSRMMLGVHYFSDVVGGFLLGVFWISLGAAFVSWRGSGGN